MIFSLSCSLCDTLAHVMSDRESNIHVYYKNKGKLPAVLLDSTVFISTLFCLTTYIVFQFVFVSSLTAFVRLYFVVYPPVF